MVARILLGKFPDGGKGLRISEPGYGVRANPPNNERLWFNSDWPAVMPVHYQGTFTLANATEISQTYADLGYLPFYDANVESNSTFNPLNPAGTVGPYEQAYIYTALFSGGQPTTPFLQITTFHDYLLVRNYTSVTVTVYVVVYRVKAFSS